MPACVDCPVCGARVPWTEASRWRPFCSERCQLIDLGDWAAEKHRIPGEAADESTPEPPEATARPH
jgi:endogenous inhibitor of DNA gyrase (YacG/DUF329 family)